MVLAWETKLMFIHDAIIMVLGVFVGAGGMFMKIVSDLTKEIQKRQVRK